MMQLVTQVNAGISPSAWVGWSGDPYSVRMEDAIDQKRYAIKADYTVFMG